MKKPAKKIALLLVVLLFAGMAAGCVELMELGVAVVESGAAMGQAAVDMANDAEQGRYQKAAETVILHDNADSF